MFKARSHRVKAKAKNFLKFLSSLLLLPFLLGVNTPFQCVLSILMVMRMTSVSEIAIHLLLLRSLGQGNVCTPVCQSFCSQGCLRHCMLGYTPQADTSQADTPLGRTPRADTPSTKYGIRSTHPTRMNTGSTRTNEVRLMAN